MPWSSQRPALVLPLFYAVTEKCLKVGQGGFVTFYLLERAKLRQTADLPKPTEAQHDRPAVLLTWATKGCREAESLPCTCACWLINENLDTQQTMRRINADQFPFAAASGDIRAIQIQRDVLCCWPWATGALGL